MQESIPLGPAAPVNPKEMDFAIQLFEAGLRMKIPVSVSETRGVDFGDNAAAQMLIDTMPEELGLRFVAQEGRVVRRDPELQRGAFLHHGVFTCSRIRLTGTCGKNGTSQSESDGRSRFTRL